MKKSPIEIWREQKKKYSFFGKKGKILTLSKVIQAPGRLVCLAPYWVGLIKFSKGRKVAGQIICLKREPKIGDVVVGVIRRMVPPDPEGIIEYGVKFKVLS